MYELKFCRKAKSEKVFFTKYYFNLTIIQRMIIVLVVYENEVREFLYSVYEKYKTEINHAIIFGSFSRGDFTPESDIDFKAVS